jgi:hypothetical protein
VTSDCFLPINKNGKLGAELNRLPRIHGPRVFAQPICSQPHKNDKDWEERRE